MNIIGKIFGAGRFNRASNRDFRPEDLPETRVKLFFDSLSVRWSSMVGLNLFYILFWLPAIIWSGVNFLTLLDIINSAEAGAYIANQVFNLLYTFLLILWPLIALTGPATAGVSYVTRNWARGEHTFMFSDFFEQLKKNWKQALAISTITGAVPFLTFFLWRFYSELVVGASKLFIVPEALVFIVATAWLLMLQVLYTLMITYKLTFRQLVKNAFVLTIAKLPNFLGLRLITIALPVLIYLSFIYFTDAVIYVLMIGGFFYLVFGLALNRLLYASLANYVCEAFINPKIGAPIDIGLRPKNGITNPNPGPEA